MKKLIIYFYSAFNFLLSDTGYYIPVKGKIDSCLPLYIERPIKIAELYNAFSIISEVTIFNEFSRNKLN